MIINYLVFFKQFYVKESEAKKRVVCLQKKVYFFLGSVFDFLKVDKKVIWLRRTTSLGFRKIFRALRAQNFPE